MITAMRRPRSAVVVTLAAALVATMAPASHAVAATTPGATITPATSVTLPDDQPMDITGGWVLRVGSAGHKVKALQQALGYPDSAWEVYDDAMRLKVRAAQARLGLEVTGRVDRATWRALRVDGRWRMDAFNQPPRTTSASTRAERIEVMVQTARWYLGSEYVWGGSGTPARGVDCSGLVLQAMYSAGLHPTGVSLRLHQTQQYRTTDALLADPGLRHVPVSKVRRGDLVFYASRATGAVNHVALALGNGRLIEAVEPQVRTAPLGDRSTQLVYPIAIRPFPVSP
jgi:cell wall-associated NlpC family hydrolase